MGPLTRRSLNLSTLGVALLAASDPPQALAAAPQKRPANPYALVDPELVDTVKLIHHIDLNAQMLAVKRAASAGGFILPAPAPQPMERSVPSPGGAPLRIYVIDASPGAKSRAGVLYIHSGGFVTQTALTEAAIAQTIAMELGCVVISVDYTLAPEMKYPGSLEQNYAALRWMHRDADALGIDPSRIGVFGISAGGGHSAVLSIAARDRGEFPISCLVMNYPMLDDRTGSSRPVPPHAGAFVWTGNDNVFGWTSLLGCPAGSTSVPKGAVAARTRKLEGLPPTYIGCGAIDLFAEESIGYAGRLMSAGVPVELLIVPGAYHAFDLVVPGADVSKRFRASWMAALKRGLSKPA